MKKQVKLVGGCNSSVFLRYNLIVWVNNNVTRNVSKRKLSHFQFLLGPNVPRLVAYMGD